MTVKLFNTLTRKKEELKTVEPGKVKMYVCGPTVYNYIHIGNARAFTMFDMVRSYLQYKGYDVTYVQNFTDVDDKLINKAREEKTRVEKLAEKYIEAYFADADALGIGRADYHPRVIEHITEIIDLVSGLIARGYAYEVNGDVYFDTKSYSKYGRLSGQNLDDLLAGARIEVDEDKKNPLDFALWKSVHDDQISWDSPWGKGRPGWHIECSAMSKKYLGETIDIHAGGQDLVFPHHENEVAQSEALSGKTFANYWMHNGYINIENKKMSKSLGNVMIVHELLKKFDGQVLRFFLLSAHYRSPVNFSEELLSQAEQGLERIRTTWNNLQHRLQSALVLDDDISEFEASLQQHVTRFEAVMDDDFNSAEALAVIFEIVRDANNYMRQAVNDARQLQAYLETLNNLLNVLRIAPQQQAAIETEVEQLVEQRQKARAERDFKLADQIRDQLLERGIVLEDTPQGVRWKRAKQT